MTHKSHLLGKRPRSQTAGCIRQEGAVRRQQGPTRDHQDRGKRQERGVGGRSSRRLGGGSRFWASESPPSAHAI